MKINGIEVPEPLREEPEYGSWYWYPVPADNKGVGREKWVDVDYDKNLLKHGFCHATEAAARRHFEALIAPSRADAQPVKSVEIDGIKEPEWIDWNGGECPIPGQECEIRTRNGDELWCHNASTLNWFHDDDAAFPAAKNIIAYRVWPAETKQAEQDKDWCPYWEGSIGLHERESCSNCTSDCGHRSVWPAETKQTEQVRPHQNANKNNGLSAENADLGPTTAEPASTLPKVSSDELNREAVRALMRRVAALSYNDSYCGERPGAVKRAVMDWTRQQTRAAADYSKVDDKYQAAAIAREQAFHLAARQAARDAEQEKPASTAPDRQQRPEQTWLHKPTVEALQHDHERQQQRFELAKAALTGVVASAEDDGSTPATFATVAIAIADAVLAELERSNG